MRLIPWTKSPMFATPSRLFEDFFTDDIATQQWLPAVDVEETENDVVVRAEIPGIDAKKVEVSVVGDVLYLHGEKNDERDEKNGNWHRIERRYGSFSRTIPLPCHVDTEKAVAKAENGVLKVTLAKRAEDKTRKIEIQVK